MSMNMVLLAAGRGARLRHLTHDRPKALVQIAGRPMLAWLLDRVREAGIESPILITGYQRDTFDEFNLETIHNPNWATTNIVGSLFCARDVLRSGPTLISYTDILYSSRDLQTLAAQPFDICVAYDPHWLDLWKRRFDDPLSDAESFKLDRNGFLVDIGARAGSVREIEGQYMGLLRMTPQGWHQLENLLGVLDPLVAAKLDITSLLSIGIRQHGMLVKALAIKDGWCEVDLPSDVAVAEEYLTRDAKRPR
jgi:choline kinase